MLKHQGGEIEDNLLPIYRIPEVSAHISICSLNGDYEVISAFVAFRRPRQPLI